jgi:hypothetical protein
VLSEPDGAWCLTVDVGGRPSWDKAAPWADPIQLQAFPTAYPLAEAVESLEGPNNPEAILAARREACRLHDEEEAAAKAAQRAASARREAEVIQTEKDRRDFNYDLWCRLDPWVQAFYALACRVTSRDPDLAADLRGIALEGRGCRPNQPSFPGCRWDAP